MSINPFEQISALLDKVPGNVSLKTQKQLLNTVEKDSFEAEVVKVLGIVSVTAQNGHYTFGFKIAGSHPLSELGFEGAIPHVGALKVDLKHASSVTFDLKKTAKKISLSNYRGLTISTNVPMVSGELQEVSFAPLADNGTRVEVVLTKKIFGMRTPGLRVAVTLNKDGDFDFGSLKFG